MCGIAGIYSLHGIDADDILKTEAMLNMIKHRGPDGRGIDNKKHIVLGTVRLSMVGSDSDVTLLYDKQRSLTLAFNGEIYNYPTLKSNLIQKGCHFLTDSDGEVILHLYKLYGHNFVSYLDGMFAIALWDNGAETLILARDHIGIKPLYYHMRNEKIFFASELKAFFCYNLELTEIDHYALGLYYNYRFIPAPYTIFKYVKKLEPGRCLIIDSKGLKIEDYWQPLCALGYKASSTFSLEQVFTESVSSTLMSDHKLGIFLSGGIDSGLMASVMKKSFYDTQAFTVGYDIFGSSADETESAVIISNYLGLKHKTIVLHSDSVSQDIDKVMWLLDEPHYSTVSISTYNLAKTARQYVKGVLTGDGSDELFLSYNYLSYLLENLTNNDEDILNSYIDQIGWLSTTHKMNLLDNSLYFNGQDYITEFFKTQDTILDTVRYFEMRYRLPDYHLARVDKLTMAVGLEARVPFLRKSMIEWSEQKSSMDLLQHNQSKAYLKKELSHYLPTKILCQQKKPFTTPMHHWLKFTLKEEVCDLFNTMDHTNSLGLNRTYLISLAEDFYQKGIDNSKILWGVYLLLKWYQNISDTKKYLL